ncbi:hypothetical protein [Rhodoferax sediminis]|uniref:hypothetical protein n=1 Tax=Rhodoferax sediminis TaxID=2509614 RepID=UPI00143CC2AF|nr:hypothetical protein [Rhodoferax sediminis]
MSWKKNFEALATLESLYMGAPISRTRAMKNGLLQTVMYCMRSANHTLAPSMTAW